MIHRTDIPGLNAKIDITNNNLSKMEEEKVHFVDHKVSHKERPTPQAKR